MFGWTIIQKNVVWHSKVSLIRPCENSIKWLSASFFFGKTTIRKLAFRQNDDSTKWRFRKMMWRLDELQKKLFSWVQNHLVLGKPCSFTSKLTSFTILFSSQLNYINLSIFLTVSLVFLKYKMLIWQEFNLTTMQGKVFFVAYVKY